MIPETAVNYSLAAKHLWEQGEISFDRWKCGAPGSSIGPEQAADTGLPSCIHFPLDAGDPAFFESDWDLIKQQMNETGTPFLNLHLNAKRSFFTEASLEGERKMVRDRFLTAVDGACRIFGPDKVICENVIYRGENGPYLRASVEPDLITEVIKETGAGLLLDTAHARITCEYLDGIETLDYLEQLPLEAIREVHVTGSLETDGRLRDSMPMTTVDWLNAFRVLSQCGQKERSGQQRLAGRPWLVALEYGGVGKGYEWRSDPMVIKQDLLFLSELVKTLF